MNDELTGMDAIRSVRGLIRKVALGIGLTPSAVSQWDQVPAERVVEVECHSGIARETLRPDLYRRENANDAR